jgi:hypothetical protein
MPDHDALYHRLFSHPGMVAQLLREFVAGPWLDDLDLDRMERRNAKFHAESHERRDGDMIWHIPRRDGEETYLVLLLGFQSIPNPWMALRALVYVGLLWQHLVKEGRLLPNGRLPPVLPVVLYNGDRRCCFGWKALLIPSRWWPWPMRCWLGSCVIRGGRACARSLPNCWAA